MDASDRIQCASLWSIAVLLQFQVSVKYRRQHEHGRCLSHLVPNGWYPKRPELAGLFLRDQNLSHRSQHVRSVLQVPRQFPEPPLHPVCVDIAEALPVRPGLATVAACQPPGSREKVLPPNLVVQCMKATSAFFLRFRMQKRSGVSEPSVTLLGSRQRSCLAPFPFPSRSRSPFLGRHCPVPSVVRACPPPCRPGLPLAGIPVGACTPPTGLPVLPRLPSSMHASATSPAEAVRCTCRFSSQNRRRPSPKNSGGSAPAFARFDACSAFAHVPVCMVAELPITALCHRSASAHVVTSMNRSGCYQPKATIVGWDSHSPGKRAFPRRTESFGLARIPVRPPATDVDHRALSGLSPFASGRRCGPDRPGGRSR